MIKILQNDLQGLYGWDREVFGLLGGEDEGNRQPFVLSQKREKSIYILTAEPLAAERVLVTLSAGFAGWQVNCEVIHSEYDAEKDRYYSMLGVVEGKLPDNVVNLWNAALNR